MESTGLMLKSLDLVSLVKVGILILARRSYRKFVVRESHLNPLFGTDTRRFRRTVLTWSVGLLTVVPSMSAPESG